MPNILRLNSPHRGDNRRWLVGLLVSSQCTELHGTLIGVSEHGLSARVDVHGTLSAPVPRELAAVFATWDTPGACPAGAMALFRAQLAEAQAALAAELLAGCGIAPSRILALGVHDPGLWAAERSAGSRQAGYLGLCDAARLAEASGLNVIDAFPARDVAQGGLGGPLTPLAEWLLLHHPSRARVLLDLGRTVRLTYLPAAKQTRAVERILAFEVGPGTSLLDVLAQRLTGGEQAFDSGGRLAVQGKRIPELIEHWLRDSYFDGPLPRWHPRGVRPQRFLADAMQLAVARDWSVRDLLCSATHFVAEGTVRAVNRRLAQADAVAEVVVTGGGQHNGMLLREIAQRLSVPLVRAGDLGERMVTGSEPSPRNPVHLRGREVPVSVPSPSDGLGPACVAVLAMFYLDQVPANLTAVTGAEVPRVLGRLTPGSPQHWQRLLQACVGAPPPVRSLRSAL